MKLLQHCSFHTLFLLLAIYGLTTAQMNKFADDPGVGWHLQTGDWILESKSLPRSDPFLQTKILADGTHDIRPWVADQWLSDVLLAKIFQLGGYPLLYASFLVLCLWTFFGVLYRALCRQSGAGFAALAAMLLAFKIAQVHFILRPVQISFFFFAILLACLWAWDTQVALSRAKQGMASLQIFTLFLLWSNSHPAFVLGGLLLVVFFFAKLLEHFLGWKAQDVSPHLSQRKLLSFSLLLCLSAGLGTLCNPYGLDLHRSILGLAGSDFFMTYHQEWQPPRMGEFIGILLQTLVGFTLVLPLLFKKIPQGWTLFQLLSFFIFARFAFDATRMAPFFAMVASLPLIYSWRASAPLLERAGGAFVRLGLLFHSQGQREFLHTRGLLLLPALSLLLLLCALPIWETARVGMRSANFGPSAERFPYVAVQHMLADAETKEPGGVFSPARWGGFLIRMGQEGGRKQGQGKLKPLLDDRNELQGEAWYKRFEKATLQEAEFQAVVQEYKARYVLWPKESSLLELFETRAGLEKLFEDNVAVLWRIESGHGESFK